MNIGLLVVENFWYFIRLVLIRENKLTKCRQDMEKMLKLSEVTMAEIVADLKTFRTGGEYQYAWLHSHCSHFGLALPSFLADLKERDTGQYTNITTIATFFSSVTATTLQISYSSSLPFSELLAVINLFWFLSLVFSVSAGVSSLVGLMWRKSPMCVFLLIYVPIDYIYMNLQLRHKPATRPSSIMARKSPDGIPDHSRIDLHCWLEPPGLRSTTGMQH